ncbi:MAG: hypothetical protein WCN88_04980 [Candidatus Falkowbacteria bacterium]
MSVKKERYQITPTKYDAAAHTALLLKMLSQGNSRAMFCAEVKIAARTFNDWLEKYPEFLDAYETGMVDAQAYWEKMAVDNMGAPNFNYSLWLAIMRDRFNYSEHKKFKFKGINTVKAATARCLSEAPSFDKNQHPLMWVSDAPAIDKNQNPLESY